MRNIKISKELNEMKDLLIENLSSFSHLRKHKDKIIVFVSSSRRNSKYYARIFGLRKILFEISRAKYMYFIEVNENYLKKVRNFYDFTRTLIHELSHITKRFTGTVYLHNRRFREIYYSAIDELNKNKELREKLKFLFEQLRSNTFISGKHS